jgi:uncharacterized repeat protein (TIGR03803 family)
MNYQYPIRLRAASAALTLMLMLVLGVITIPSSQAQTFTVLYSFSGPPDGAGPYAGLVRDAKGNFYGTTWAGGAGGGCANQNPPGCGTVFKVDTKSVETVLYSFTGGTDGESPKANVIQDKAGTLYGTTIYGGASGNGVVFKVDSSGTETVLHSFAGGTSDGCNPWGGLIRDKAGNLYGTTPECGSAGGGTVFKLDTSGTETVLHSFTGSDGANPYFASLLMDKKENLYGVTEYGGAYGAGVVYKLSKSGALTVLHSFDPWGVPADGGYPGGTVVMDKMGNLYGTTWAYGPSGNGIVWKLGKNGTETVLHSFTGYPGDGGWPLAGVVRDEKGNIYGDTLQGGSSNVGVVYKLSKSGVETVLHSFSYYSEGAYALGGVIRDAKRNLYGTLLDAGPSGYGTVWKLTP